MGTDIRHIDKDRHWIKQQCIRDIIAPVAVDSEDNVADLGTKNTSAVVFATHTATIRDGMSSSSLD